MPSHALSLSALTARSASDRLSRSTNAKLCLPGSASLSSLAVMRLLNATLSAGMKTDNLHIEALEDSPQLLLVLSLAKHTAQTADVHSGAAFFPAVHCIRQMLLCSDRSLPVDSDVSTAGIPIAPSREQGLGLKKSRCSSVPFRLAWSRFERVAFDCNASHFLDGVFGLPPIAKFHEAVARVAASHWINGYVDLFDASEAIIIEGLLDILWSDVIQQIANVYPATLLWCVRADLDGLASLIDVFTDD